MTADPREVENVVRSVAAVLEERWPEIPFAVATEDWSGRAVVVARWTDGPTQAEVARLTRHLEIWPRGEPDDQIPPVVAVQPARTLSPAFKRIVIDKIRDLTGEPYDGDRRYDFTFEGVVFSAAGEQLIWQVSCYLPA